MGEAGKAATEGSREVISQIKESNRDVVVDTVTTDPTCIASLPSPLIIGGAGPGGLCRAGPAQPGDFRIKRWTDAEFAPSFAVIDGLAAYLGAVDAVVSRKSVDIAGELSGAQAKLEAVLATFADFAKIPAAPTLSADQSAAISATLSLISELIDEADRVRDLRKIEVGTDQAKFTQSLDALKRVDAELMIDLEAQYMHKQTLVGGALKRAGGSKVPLVPPDPFETRRALTSQYLATAEGREAIPALAAALDATVEAFRQSHEAYRTLLFDSRSPVTPAEKRKQAQVAERRVLAALSALSSLIKAF